LPQKAEQEADGRGRVDGRQYLFVQGFDCTRGALLTKDGLMLE
jgi:hypothetical protein